MWLLCGGFQNGEDQSIASKLRERRGGSYGFPGRGGTEEGELLGNTGDRTALRQEQGTSSSHAARRSAGRSGKSWNLRGQHGGRQAGKILPGTCG